MKKNKKINKSKINWWTIPWKKGEIIYWSVFFVLAIMMSLDMNYSPWFSFWLGFGLSKGFRI
jgi:hypothetical protein